MSFVSNFGKKVSNKTKEISQKAKVMSETSSLNNIIKGEQCKIDFQYKTIGKLYFEKYGENPDTDFTEAVQIIKTSMEKIEETKQEITKIRSRFNCPGCGEPFKNDALFCSKCGAKLPEREEEKPKIPADAQKCEKCGNILKKEALFCNVCGNKLNAQEVVAITENNDTYAPQQENKEAVAIQESKTESAAIEVSEETKTEAVIAEAENPPKEEIVQSDEKPDITEESVNETEVKIAEDKANEDNEKICPNCNNKMASDDVFCNECGTKVE